MRFAHTDDELEFASAVRSLFDNECPPEVVRAAWPADADKGEGSRAEPDAVDRLWEQLAQMGVLSVAVDADDGGFGLDEMALTPIMIEVGRSAVPLPVAESAAIVAPLLASTRDAPRSLAGVMDGSVRVGVDLFDTGRVAHADVVDACLVRVGNELHWLAIELLDRIELDAVDGARHLASVSPSAGEWGDHSTLVTNEPDEVERTIDRAVLATAAQLVGLGRAMVDLTVGYAKERQQFGAAIGTFQAVKHHLADAALQLEFATPAVARAAHSVATGSPDRARDVSMAKLMAGDAAAVAGAKALQVHGGIGYTVEYDLHLFQKRAWALKRTNGTDAWHRTRVGAALGV